jgi:hypothetical protein
MPATRLPVVTDSSRVDDVLHSMFDGVTPVVAVEIFDDPTSRWSDRVGATIGPWVLGTVEEVSDYLSMHGHRDYAEQYGYGNPHL